mgnify:CR=1 FL=1
MNSSNNGSIIKIWLFVLVFFPLTLRLGYWQLERSEEKKALLSMMDQRFSSPSVVLDIREPILAFRPYNLIGRFEEKHYLLDNRIRDGQVGYEIISPFYVNGDKDLAYIMVNRGWVKASKYRDQLPVINSPVGMIGLQGYFHETDGKVPVLKETLAIEGWPKRIQQVSWDAFSQQQTGELLFEYEFRLVEKDRPNDDLIESAHYKLGWPRTSILPEKHTAYAYQWFALAIVLLILAISATYKIRREDKDDE